MVVYHFLEMGNLVAKEVFLNSLSSEGVFFFCLIDQSLAVICIVLYINIPLKETSTSELVTIWSRDVLPVMKWHFFNKHSSYDT